jgi:hypothetical protein
MEISENHALMLNKLGEVRNSTSSYIAACYLTSKYNHNDLLIMQAMLDADLLNGHMILLFPETSLGDFDNLPVPVLQGMAGAMLGRAKPVDERYSAYMDWVQTVNMSTLTSMGLEGTAGTSGETPDPAWLESPHANLKPWHTFRVDATIMALNVLYDIKKQGLAIDSANLISGIQHSAFPGIMGDISWDENQDRQGLVYEILQLQQEDGADRPTLKSIGEMILTPDEHGQFVADLDYSLVRFQPQAVGSDGHLLYTQAPNCDPGRSKPDSFSLKSECTECPVGTHSSANTGFLCQACSEGLYADEPGLSRCFSCSAGSFSAVLGSESCTLCPAGKATTNSGAVACELCPAGTFAAAPGRQTCELCPVGQYVAEEGAKECTICAGLLTTKHPGASNVSACRCPEGTYQEAGGGACKPCPDGMECPFASDMSDY